MPCLSIRHLVFEQKPLTKAWPGKSGRVVVVRFVEVESLFLCRRHSEQLGVPPGSKLPPGNAHFQAYIGAAPRFTSTECTSSSSCLPCIMSDLSPKGVLPRQNAYFVLAFFLNFAGLKTLRGSGRKHIFRAPKSVDPHRCWLLVCFCSKPCYLEAPCLAGSSWPSPASYNCSVRASSRPPRQA